MGLIALRKPLEVIKGSLLHLLVDDLRPSLYSAPVLSRVSKASSSPRLHPVPVKTESQETVTIDFD